ncbi:hypothetical protein AVEN_208611-1 [Araneus ventricosus]|uniref:Uncharacterized protein n=1 Tax=Araneus ventricosus TaxID=182803 RepID=A0A4Y2PUW8_ARAVE|nr:hypothetical protein AVEN_208611-1 [Araneus ventricosus]
MDRNAEQRMKVKIYVKLSNDRLKRLRRFTVMRQCLICSVSCGIATETMLIAFCNACNIIHREFVPQGQTVNKVVLRISMMFEKESDESNQIPAGV